ncbi:MAG: aldolase/citrate lyase family protein [Gemmataceae bacterium]
MGQLCHPKLIELVAYLGGFDAVWLDQEHVGLTIPQIEEGTRACRAAGIDVFVRLHATDYASVMRVLEAGASGMMISMVRTVEQARDLVRWAKFHPAGERGVNGTGVDGRYGSMKFADYLKASNDKALLGVQIEHIDAVNVIDEICAVPEIDFLFIGPADLSQSMGITGEWEHPRLWEAIERVATACQRAGRHWGVLPLSPAFARRCVDLGCKILGLGIDMWVVRKGMQAFQEEYAEYFGQ